MSATAVAAPTPIRHKRNFKALQLPQTPRVAHKRPQPLVVLSTAAHITHSEHDFDIPSSSASNGRQTIQQTLAKLDKEQQHASNGDDNAATKRPTFDLQHDELKSLQELGQGNGGSVMKVEHVLTGTIMAKKVWRNFPLFVFTNSPQFFNRSS